MDGTRQLRELLARQLDWENAHAGFERAVAAFPPDTRGLVPAGLDHSGWQLLEHLRLAQVDILDFCVDPDYVEPSSLDEYWPSGPEPEDDAEWDECVAAFRADMDSLRRLALDEDLDLFAEVPNGDGQTYLRELLLVVDHNAYHLGQLVLLRRLLGCWE